MFLGCLGVIALLGSIFMAGVATFFNLRYGWIVPDPDTPARNQIAFTASNITYWQLTFWVGVTSLVASSAWFRGRWRMACGVTILAWILMGVSLLFAPPKQ